MQAESTGIEQMRVATQTVAGKRHCTEVVSFVCMKLCT